MASRSRYCRDKTAGREAIRSGDRKRLRTIHGRHRSLAAYKRAERPQPSGRVASPPLNPPRPIGNRIRNRIVRRGARARTVGAHPKGHAINRKGTSVKIDRQLSGFLALGILLTTAPARMNAATSGTEALVVPGLSQPVEILKDRWGISHIYAKNETDLFFAQGYNVARDRLFQLELWRRQATGTVSEILGRRELKRDIGNRLFMYRGDLKQELNWYHPRGESIIQAFVDGVNAYISETQKNPALLTPEFKMLGITPGKWTPAVVVSRFNGLLGNIGEELNIGMAVHAIGAQKVKDILYFQP